MIKLKCEKCGSVLKRKKIRTGLEKRINLGLGYLGIDLSDYKYYCPKCYPE